MWPNALGAAAALSALALPGTALAAVASPDVHQVAIIGAGAAGSSTAYHLHRYAEENGLAVNITVFEKTDRVGGRTLTVDAFGDAAERVELGASIFVKINTILYNATSAFGLSLKAPGLDEAGVLGIWDGERFVYETNDASWGWWNLSKLFWKYGTAPYRTQQLMRTVIARFLQLYEAPFFPFRSLTTRAFELDLARITGQTGRQFLAENNIAELFSHDIIQASTRVNYASNLASIHGLETMVSVAPEGAVQVDGGNWQIFDRMLGAVNAHVHLNTTVSSISLKPKIPGDAHPQYAITTKQAGATEQVEEAQAVAFDDVVIANPWQFSGIAAGEDVLKQHIDEIPYVRLHVTLFTSPFRISPGFFGLEPAAKVPTTILTTLAGSDEPSSGAEGSGKAGFFSISTLKLTRNPRTGAKEFLYKIFSPMEVSPEFLSSLLGVEVPTSFTRSTAEGGDAAAAGMVEPISWYYPHVFYSYPKEFPRVTFQDPILGPGLYYTSGIESFISTMETSALMGMNVARLIADDLLGVNSGGAVLAQEAQGEGQNVVVDEL